MADMLKPTLKPAVSPIQLRAELGTVVLKELLGPGSAEEELIESPGTRYFVGVLAPRKRAARGVEHEPPQPAVNEPTRREVLARVLKRNHERYSEEVKQGFHEKGKPNAVSGKKEARSNIQAVPTLFHEEEEDA